MAGYRNGFEKRVADHLGPDWEYEPIKLPYTIPHTYTPDFVHHGTRTIIESKGRFTQSDRQKMIAVKAQHPDWTFHILFQNPNLKISKGSKTTYAQWAERNGFQWSSI